MTFVQPCKELRISGAKLPYLEMFTFLKSFFPSRLRSLLQSTMAPESSRLSNVRLEDHPTARNRAISVDILPSGSTIVSVPALTTILLPDQKGQRCDACLRHKSESIHLMACTGCRSYWYCGRKCTSQFSGYASMLLNHRAT